VSSRQAPNFGYMDPCQDKKLKRILASGNPSIQRYVNDCVL